MLSNMVKKTLNSVRVVFASYHKEMKKPSDLKPKL